MHQDHLTRLAQAMQAEKLDAIALNPSPNLYYLTGLSFHLMERPVIGLFTPDQKPLLILPELERPKADAFDIDLELISYTESEVSRNQDTSDAVVKLGLSNRRASAEILGLRMVELRLLETAALAEVCLTSCLVAFLIRLFRLKFSQYRLHYPCLLRPV